MRESYQVVKRTKAERRVRRLAGLINRRAFNRALQLHAKGDAESQGHRKVRYYPSRKEKRAGQTCQKKLKDALHLAGYYFMLDHRSRAFVSDENIAGLKMVYADVLRHSIPIRKNTLTVALEP
ncbi:MAG: hypothetical protein NTY77_05590 [Elusimicrobia bacterium]|nr:hypothetical protein [Elusimicrobiota bacterium]